MLLGLSLVAGCGSAPETGPAPTPAPEIWLKGQLHAHTSNSSDSQTPPGAALQWFARHGFDFVVVTDHNFVTVVAGGPVLAIPGIELTQNLDRCHPAPEAGMQCLLHINALFVDPARAGRFSFPPTPELDRRALYGRAIAATRELGGLAQLNHPNFHYSADGSMLADLTDDGLRLFELANEAVDSNNAGDATHPSTEAMWDAALARGKPVWGVATDDAHHYDDAASVEQQGEQTYVGDRGFVMVRAAREPAAIRAAIERGDFYASNRVLLTGLSTTGNTLKVSAAATHEIRFVGATGDLWVTRASEAAYALADTTSHYVRAVVTDANGRKAWTQPLFRR